MESIRTDQGYTILAKQTRSYSVSLGLYIKVGARNEKKEKNGITHLLEHLHFRKLCSFNQQELYNFLECRGAVFTGKTFKDMLMFHLKFSPKYFEDMIYILTCILKEKDWSQEDLSKEKHVVGNQIRESDYFHTMDFFSDKLLWGNHPLSNSIMGTENSIANISLEDIIEHKRNYFVPERMVVVLTGNFKQKYLTFLEQRLNKIEYERTSGIIFDQEFHQIKRKPSVKIINVNADELIDVKIMFDIPPLISCEEVTILNCILGEGIGSRLQMSLREEKKLTSNIRSYVEYYTDTSHLMIEYSVLHKHFLASLLEISSILKGLKENVTNLDMDSSLPFYTDNASFILDDPEELNINIANTYLIHSDVFNINESVNKFSNITTTHITESAKKIFIKDRLSILVMGCTRNTRKQIIDAFEAL